MILRINYSTLIMSFGCLWDEQVIFFTSPSVDTICVRDGQRLLESLSYQLERKENEQAYVYLMR